MNTGPSPAAVQDNPHTTAPTRHVPAQPTGPRPTSAAKAPHTSANQNQQAEQAQRPVVYATKKEAELARRDIDRLNQLADRNQNWVMGIGAVALIFTITNVTLFAVDHGIPLHIAWILDLVVNAALVRVLYTDGRLALLIPGYKPAGWSLALRYFAFTATWAMNAWTSLFPDGHFGIPRHVDPAGLLLHSALPILVFVMAEYSSHNRKRTTDQVTKLQAVIDSYEEGVKAEQAAAKAEADRKREAENARRREEDERRRREEAEEREREREAERLRFERETKLQQLELERQQAEVRAAAAEAEARAAALKANAEADAVAAAEKARAEAEAARIAAETEAAITKQRADYELQQQARRDEEERQRQEEERRRAEEAERKRREAAEKLRREEEERQRKLREAAAAARTTTPAASTAQDDEEDGNVTSDGDVVQMSRQERHALQERAIQEAAVELVIWGGKEALPFTTAQFGARFDRKPRWGGLRINDAVARLESDPAFKAKVEELALTRMEEAHGRAQNG
ncbi:hypothetical protein ACWDTQ_22870 [Streptomyces cellulosae]